MSDDKQHTFRPPLYQKDSRNASRDKESKAGREQQGWDAYRKWLSSMNARPKSRRAPIDHSVYSWKGYQNWANRVRQAMKSEDS